MMNALALAVHLDRHADDQSFGLPGRVYALWRRLLSPLNGGKS